MNPAKNPPTRHKYQEAASSVFTFLVQHPDDEVMRSNLNYYLTLTEVDRQKIVNFEAENFVPLYIVGTEAYIREDYESTINHLEESLEEYLKSEEECRADCEGPFDQGWLPDFTSSVSNHFVYCLKCKQRCRFQLGNLNGETYNDLLPSHYHYLQFAYYKLGKISEACGAAATYLLFFPTDETMQSNMEFYKNLPEVEENMFKPRNEAVLYTKRQEYEVRLLSYIADEFVFPEGQVKEEEPRPEETMTTRNENNNNAMKKSFPSFLDSLSTKTMSQAQIGEYHWSGCSRDQCNDEDEKKMVHSMNTQNRMLGTEEGVTSASYKEEKEDENITTAWEENKETECLHLKLYNSVQRKVYNLKQENQLSGKMRFSLDGLADELECQRLVQLAQMAGVQGDGYKANKSPHSSLEKFEGLSLGRAALMVHFGLLGSDILELFIRLSERGRNLTAHYFNVQEELYFSYTHLVCRTALPGRPANASLLSHPIHADNCLLLQNGDCLRRDPAYTWRDFSAILYLNDDFEGGEFIFSADPLGKVIQSSIKPKCGRMVGFSAGEENLHGVKGVQQGQRCAIGLWFTLDPQHSEWGRILAEHMLNDMKTHGTSSEWVLDELQNLVNFDLSTAQLRIQELQATEQCSNQNTDSTTPTLLDGKLHSTKLTST